MFWEHAWLHEGPLKEAFPKLYDCCDDKEILFHDCWNGEEWNLNFRRSFGLEEMREWENLMLELDHIQLNGDADTVRWKLEKSGSCSTKSMYRQLSSNVLLANT